MAFASCTVLDLARTLEVHYTWSALARMTRVLLWLFVICHSDMNWSILLPYLVVLIIYWGVSTGCCDQWYHMLQTSPTSLTLTHFHYPWIARYHSGPWAMQFPLSGILSLVGTLCCFVKGIVAEVLLKAYVHYLLQQFWDVTQIRHWPVVFQCLSIRTWFF